MSYICATGAYVPERVVTNAELATSLDTSDEWIVAHTGIRERRWAAPDEATSDLAAHAARRALTAANCTAADIDLVICATSSPDYPQPATAAMIHGALQMRRAAGAFDVNAVCSGAPLAILMASALVDTTPQLTRVLVVAADCYSRVVDPADRTTAIFFGDGAGACVVAADDVAVPAKLAPGASTPMMRNLRVAGSAMGTDFSGHEALIVAGGGSRFPLHATAGAAMEHSPFLKMDGRAVREFAVPQLVAVVRECCSRASLEPSDIDLLVPHQSNVRMLEAAARELAIPFTRVANTVECYGNTATASPLIALDHALRAGHFPRDNIVLAGYGSGLSWSAIALRG